MKSPAALVLVLALAGCGGVAGTPSATSPTNPVTTPPTTGSSSPPSNPGTVNVAGGQTVTGIDIAVVSPQASPAPNAENLGVAMAGGTASAYNTGDVIHRGTTARVLLFGPGLNGNMKVTIEGAPGITVANIVSITATDNTPGISFTATVASDAALGARTVSLQNAQGDITTFTGGMEVVP